MKELLTEYEALGEAVGRVESSACRSWTTPSDDSAWGALLQKVSERQSQLSQKAVFLDVEWADAPDDAAIRLIDDPLLSRWRHWIGKPWLVGWPPRDGCSSCGSPMKVLAVITDPPEVRRILLHLIKTGVAPPYCASQGRSLSLTQAKIPTAGHRRAESPRVATDLPGCGDSHGSPDRPAPLAEPHPQHRTPELRVARRARRITLPTSCSGARHSTVFRAGMARKETRALSS